MLIQRVGVNLPPEVKLPAQDQTSLSTESSSSNPISQAFGIPVTELLQGPPVPLRPGFPRLLNTHSRLQGIGNREPSVWTGTVRAWYLFIPGEHSTKKARLGAQPNFYPPRFVVDSFRYRITFNWLLTYRKSTGITKSYQVGCCNERLRTHIWVSINLHFLMWKNFLEKCRSVLINSDITLLLPEYLWLLNVLKIKHLLHMCLVILLSAILRHV